MSCCGWIAILGLVVLAFAGCGRSKVDQALESDANGYLCPQCKTKFYTARSHFADFCPQCKNNNIQQVVGYVCAVDQQMTLGQRGRGAVACSKCGKPTSGLSIPGESDLKAWGATKKTAAEVGGN